MPKNYRNLTRISTLIFYIYLADGALIYRTNIAKIPLLYRFGHVWMPVGPLESGNIPYEDKLIPGEGNFQQRMDDCPTYCSKGEIIGSVPKVLLKESFGTRKKGLAVNIFAVADLDYLHDQVPIFDGIEDAVTSLSYPVLFLAGDFFASPGTRVLGQLADACH